MYIYMFSPKMQSVVVLKHHQQQLTRTEVSLVDVEETTTPEPPENSEEL